MDSEIKNRHRLNNQVKIMRDVGLESPFAHLGGSNSNNPDDLVLEDVSPDDRASSNIYTLHNKYD